MLFCTCANMYVRKIPRNGIICTEAMCICNVARLYTNGSNCCINLHCHQWCIRMQSYISNFFIFANVMVKKMISSVLICIPLKWWDWVYLTVFKSHLCEIFIFFASFSIRVFLFLFLFIGIICILGKLALCNMGSKAFC